MRQGLLVEGFWTNQRLHRVSRPGLRCRNSCLPTKQQHHSGASHGAAAPSLLQADPRAVGGGFSEGTEVTWLLGGGKLHHASPNPWMPAGGQLLPKGFLLTQTFGSDGHTRNWRTRQLPVVWLVHSITPGPQHASSCRTCRGLLGTRERVRSHGHKWSTSEEGNMLAWPRRTPSFPTECSSFPGPLCLKVQAAVQSRAKCRGDDQVR